MGVSRYQFLWAAIFLALCYFLTMPVQFLSHDGEHEFLKGLHGLEGYRSTHILTTVTFSGVLQIGQLFWSPENSFIAINLFNIVFSVLTMFCLYRMLVLSNVEAKLAVGFCLVFGLTNVVWDHSIQPETGIHSLFFFTLALLFLYQGLKLFEDTENNSPRLVEPNLLLAFLFLLLSTLYDYTSIMFFPAFAIPILLIECKRNGAKGFFRVALFSVAIAAVVILTTLIFALLSNVQNAKEGMAWLLSHSDSSKLAHLKPFSIESILRSGAGVINAFVNIGDSLTIVKIKLKGIEFRTDSQFFAVYLGIGLLFAGIFMLSALVGFIKLFKTQTNLAIGLGLIVVTQFLFSMYWLGSDPQFWMQSLPVILYLTAIALKDQKLLAMGLVVLFALTALLFNKPAEMPSIIYEQGGGNVKRSYQFDEAMGVNKQKVVYSVGWGWPIYLPYTSPTSEYVSLVYDDRYDTPNPFLAEFCSDIRSNLNKGKLIYIEGVFKPFLTKQFGAWEMLSSGRNVNKEQLEKWIETHFEIEEISGFSALFQIKALKKNCD